MILTILKLESGNMGIREPWTEIEFDLGGNGLPPPPPNFFINFLKKILLVYTWLFILAILLYKITLFSLNIIVNSFKNNVITTKFSTTFLQIS